ncbi:MAG: PHB depolymerase family esterase [Pyrinomonadaceae bacterium]
MKKFLTVLCAIFLLPVAASATKSIITKELVASQGKTRAYYLYVPDSVKAAKPAPLILMLHGSGRSGSLLVEKWKDLADKEGIILAGPDAQNPAGWSTEDDPPAFLHDVVEAVKAKCPVNPRRVYLFGHSAGAIYGLYLSLLESEYFAATAVHAGAMTKEDASFIDNAKRKIPLALYVGTNDAYFPLKAVRATRDMLKERGFSVELTEIPNHDHNYYGIAKEINNGAWKFLKQHELSGEPHYEEYRTN